jgi:DNA-binding Lrp family transcriptional regulator
MPDKIRAYVIAKIDSSKLDLTDPDALDAFLGKIIDSPIPEAYIVRADLVYGPFDIVIPVVANDLELLKSKVLSKIAARKEIKETMTLLIAKNWPFPPKLGYAPDQGDATKIRADNAWG